MKRLLNNLNSARRRTIGRRGFTLVEILIVVIILGILAAIAMPAFSNSTQETKANMLRENLRVVRTQLGAYRAQHRDVSPGYPNGDTSASPTEESFFAQMTEHSDAFGDTTAAKVPYGPYLRDMPKNPINDKKRVQNRKDCQ